MRDFVIPNGETVQIEGDPDRVYLPSHYAKIFIECLEGQPLAGKRFLDIGCGSGIIGIAAAKLGADVVCSDINEDAVASALENADRNGVSVTGYVSMGFDALGNEDLFDMIACNAPSNPNVVNEIVTPVDNGADGRAFLDLVLENAPRYLRTGGKLLSCSGSEQDWTRTSALLTANYADYRVIADLDEDFSSLSQFSEEVLQAWVDRGLCWRQDGKVFHNVKYFFAYK